MAGLEARGHIAWNIRLFDGELSYGRAEVGCAAIVGNTAWIAGPVRSIVIDGVQWIPPNGPRWAVMRVRDLGEGSGQVDVASILSFMPQNAVPLWCTLLLGPPPTGLLPEFPITRGNITVHSR